MGGYSVTLYWRKCIIFWRFAKLSAKVLSPYNKIAYQSQTSPSHGTQNITIKSAFRVVLSQQYLLWLCPPFVNFLDLYVFLLFSFLFWLTEESLKISLVDRRSHWACMRLVCGQSWFSHSTIFHWPVFCWLSTINSLQTFSYKRMGCGHMSGVLHIVGAIFFSQPKWYTDRIKDDLGNLLSDWSDSDKQPTI